MFSSTLARVDGFDIGKHPLVVRLMRGVCNTRPPVARYSSTWDVTVVLKYISEHLGGNNGLRLMQLSAKTAMLLALTTLMRVSELAAIDAQSIRFTQDGVSFSLLKYRKTQRSGSLPCFSIKSLPADTAAEAYCPVVTLRSYLEATRSNRSSAESRQFLFISVVRPFRKVVGSTVGRWMKDVLRDAGIDTGFTAHSTRGAGASRAAAQGIPVMSILRLASWAAESTFTTFYRREVQQPDVGNAIMQLDDEQDSA